MTTGIFDYKSPNFSKLSSFGFTQSDGKYCYSAHILNGQFELRVDVFCSNGEVKTEVIDTATDEPYALYTVKEASGAFVGAVRSECERVLMEISEQCFEKDVFKRDYSRKIIGYVREKYGDELQFLWSKFPSNAVWRRKDNGKRYGILLTVSKRKLGLDSDEMIEIIDLRIDPDVLPKLVDDKRYFRGYHMNKKTWMTICLDGLVPFEEICDWLDKSCILAL